MTWPTYDGPGPTKVGGLGDSILTLTQDDLAVVNAASPRQWMQASYPGVKAAGLIPFGWAGTLAGTCPQHVVIVAGTNDCAVPDAEWNALGILAMQQALVDCFPLSTVHWVKVYANPPAPPTGCDLQAHVQGFNNGLAYWAGQRPNLRLVDWPACVFFFAMNGVVTLQSDGIHPTTGGQQALAHIINTSIAGG